MAYNINESRKQSWNLLPEEARALIIARWPHFADPDSIDWASKKAPDRLLISAMQSAVYADRSLTTECSRCGGSGQYSFCPQYGTTCFKCQGTGRQVISLRRNFKRWIAAAEARRQTLNQ